MDLEIHERDKEGIRILDLRGRLTIGQSEAALREAIGKLTKAGITKIILNFAEVTELDEDGLAALVLCSAKVRKHGGDLKLMNLSRVHMDLMVHARLNATFDFFRNEIDAVNSFFPERAVPRFDILQFVEEQERSIPGEQVR
jgi:anti-sigma B factor antagonist